MRVTKTLQATAYHEAAHAVVAWREGIKVTAVSIEPDETSNGRVSHRNPLAGIQLESDGSTRARLRVESLIRVLFAGAVAQKKFNPRGFQTHHIREDSERTADLILRIVGSAGEASAYLKLLYIRTENALALPHVWEAVERLAAQLLDHRNLTGRKAREIIQAR